VKDEPEKRGKLIKQLEDALLLSEELNDPTTCLFNRVCAGRSESAAVPAAERRLGWRTMMRQRSAVSLTFVVALLWANLAWASSINREDIRVIDDDTIRVFQKKPNVRLVGFNAPETRRALCEAERELGAKATRRVRDLVRDGNLDFEFVACSCQPGTEGTTHG
jgi:hypothetical protein